MPDFTPEEVLALRSFLQSMGKQNSSGFAARKPSATPCRNGDQCYFHSHGGCWFHHERLPVSPLVRCLPVSSALSPAYDGRASRDKYEPVEAMPVSHQQHRVIVIFSEVQCSTITFVLPSKKRKNKTAATVTVSAQTESSHEIIPVVVRSVEVRERILHPAPLRRYSEDLVFLALASMCFARDMFGFIYLALSLFSGIATCRSSESQYCVHDFAPDSSQSTQLHPSSRGGERDAKEVTSEVSKMPEACQKIDRAAGGGDKFLAQARRDQTKQRRRKVQLDVNCEFQEKVLCLDHGVLRPKKYMRESTSQKGWICSSSIGGKCNKMEMFKDDIMKRRADV